MAASGPSNGSRSLIRNGNASHCQNAAIVIADHASRCVEDHEPGTEERHLLSLLISPSACAGPRCRGGRRGRVSSRQSGPGQRPEPLPSTVSHRPFLLGRLSPSPYLSSNVPNQLEPRPIAPTRTRRRPTWRWREARARCTARQPSSSSSSLSLSSHRSEFGLQLAYLRVEPADGVRLECHLLHL